MLSISFIMILLISRLLYIFCYLSHPKNIKFIEVTSSTHYLERWNSELKSKELSNSRWDHKWFLLETTDEAKYEEQDSHKTSEKLVGFKLQFQWKKLFIYKLIWDQCEIDGPIFKLSEFPRFILEVSNSSR